MNKTIKEVFIEMMKKAQEIYGLMSFKENIAGRREVYDLEYERKIKKLNGELFDLMSRYKNMLESLF